MKKKKGNHAVEFKIGETEWLNWTDATYAEMKNRLDAMNDAYQGMIREMQHGILVSYKRLLDRHVLNSEYRRQVEQKKAERDQAIEAAKSGAATIRPLGGDKVKWTVTYLDGPPKKKTARRGKKGRAK